MRVTTGMYDNLPAISLFCIHMMDLYVTAKGITVSHQVGLLIGSFIESRITCDSFLETRDRHARSSARVLTGFFVLSCSCVQRGPSLNGARLPRP